MALRSLRALRFKVVITIFVHRGGVTEPATSIDRGWLNPASGAFVWVDLAAPSVPESLILSDTFAFHPLSVEDAMAPVEYPKAEEYNGYLYVVEIEEGDPTHLDPHIYFLVHVSSDQIPITSITFADENNDGKLDMIVEAENGTVFTFYNDSTQFKKQ